MVSIQEYQQREEEFAARTDALCQNIRPAECDCGKCPCKGLCDWLIANEP